MDVVETDEYSLIDDYLGSGVEFVEGSSGVKGRLKQCISYWESTICAPPPPPPVCFRPDF